MIFQALYQFAKEQKLLDDLDHDNQGIHCVIRLSQTGDFLGVIDERERATVLEIPVSEIGSRTSAAIAAIGADTMNHVIPGHSSKEKERDRQTQRLFRRILIRIARSTRHAGCQAIAAFLKAVQQDEKTHKRIVEALSKFDSSDWVTFQVAGVESETLCPTWPAVRRWWTNIRNSRRTRSRTLALQGGELSRCVVTGLECVPMKTHGTEIKVAPGGRPGGVALISADAAAFSSYGFEKALTSPMSEEAVKAYIRAINWLGDDRRENYHYRTGYKEGHTIFLFWSDKGEDMGNPGKAVERGSLDLRSWEDLLADSVELTPSAPIPARKIFKAVGGGQLDPAHAEASVRYYCLSLSGVAARGVVRGWIDQPLKIARANVERWFEHLSLPLSQPLFEKGKLLAGAGAIWSRWPLSMHLDILQGRGESAAKEIAHQRQQLWEAALLDRPIPLSILTLACSRIPTDVFTEGKRKGEWRDVRPERAALIQAALIRMNKRKDNMKTEINLDEQTVAFHCGRLLRLLQSIQTTALGDTNATVVSRFYAGASAMPGGVFGTLLSKVQPHINKIRGDKPKLAGWFDARIAEVVGYIVAGGGFPATNDPVAQGDFALGFYWQRLFTKKEQPEAEPDETETTETAN
jgi:CRISPR-associated protein Csd1